MDAINEILANIASASSGLVPILYTLFIAAGLDLVTGIWSAQTSGTLKLEFIAEFLKSHVLFKIGPVLMQLLAGVAVGGTDSAAGGLLIATGGASAALYLASVVGSIRGNLDAASSKTKALPSGATETATTDVAGPAVLEAPVPPPAG